MRKIKLGDTGLEVSRLCFGTEPFNIKKGPDGQKTQGDKTPLEGGRILAGALELGVNMWDTSDDYGTHPHVAEGLKLVKRSDVVVADKTNAATNKEGWKAVEFSLEDIGTEYMDIMFLHIVPPEGYHRTNDTGIKYYSASLKERAGALQAFMEAKETGQVRATAMSTHSTETLRQVVDFPDIDIVCTTLNMAHSHIDDGSLEEHIEAIRAVKESGKGVYVIKLLSAGRLRDNAEEAIKYALQFHEFIHAWNIGMYDLKDVRMNLELFKEVLGE
ncbi:MAG: aldo/keto reductase [Candidatus Bathyarchaeota archaeon]|nr:aldo/keto reductase [Candidatus Bathyarchaeota archaeon]